MAVSVRLDPVADAKLTQQAALLKQVRSAGRWGGRMRHPLFRRR